MNIQGQPQWRRKAITVGLPLALGIGSLELEGPLMPISGAGEVAIAVGLFHELSSCWNVMVSNTEG